MDNSTSTPLDAAIAPSETHAPPLATQIETPSSVTNGHTSPIGEEYGNGAAPADLNASVVGKGDGKGGWTPGFRAKTAPERALRWERHFTEPGQDAFETIEWEKRTAGITGEDGKSVFEQTDCEIPKSWSQLATNVVVSKYFRGPIGSPQRETSVKQVIGRVADTIGIWGASGGYFASDEDAESFRDELAFLLVHQYGAFNSPVWFNLGVKDAKQQCSACFINDVYDDMESIMELASTEARLFKGGSGAGVNLWRIRSSREHLSGGGIASGPISFMRGWDSFAGAIKSGGTTRRAAKMIILNADHPDIGEFITCKADEEKKAWALIEAGYNGGFNVPGGAYDSVAFQNANHSVRVTDEFMRAAENDTNWQLRAVTTGKVTDTTSARQMLKDIAQTTWICGDPGMQFDTIINDWHTCSNTDRIYASNPCCITGDTLVGVADGRSAVAIRDLVGTEVPVYAHDHATGKTTISRMWNIEVKRHDVPVFRVTLDDGSSLRATDDHLIMLRDGSYRMVKDLKADDSLMPFHSKNQQVWDGARWSDARQASDAVVVQEVLAAPVERCCPVCRDNFATHTPASLFCSQSCRTSPMGHEMSGQATRALNALWNDEPNSTGALRAARLLLDQNIEPSFDSWAEQRQIAAELGATRVPTAAQLPALFDSENAFRESATLWNHKVVSVELCGHEDVYDGTVDVHHNFAILTSAEQSRDLSQQNFSGIFIHNSEFMFLNSTACNLASLNLLKFYDMATGVFDAESYSKACETFLTAQEIIVSFASYPTQKIGEMSEQYRPLGLGYANLGALLMAKGLAYDSDEGRALAGALTAIMTGAGYRKSAQIARNTGPFEGYADNREPMLRVIAKHRDAVNKIDASLVAENIMQEARNVWDDAYMTGQKYGYRNSQVSVLAPTGTISFMMDCDTTGVEPDIALVKYKKLVGGGLLKIVNQTVPAALRNLGYDESEIKTIVDYIDKNDTIEGAPGLADKHLPVFDCAFKAMNGTRSIHHMGHIKMMAATQPFISGAISKTVNMPQDCTADEIYDAYLQSWKMGVKAVAIYRDGSKRTQPLSTASDAQKAEKAGKKEAEIRRAARRKLPDERNSITHKFSIAGQEGYFMVGLYEDGSPGEIFIKMSKEGSTISGLMDSFAVAVSMCLQYGVPLRVLVNKFSHTRFEPSGYTTNRDIPIAKSLMDYIFRWFDLKFHPNGDNGHLSKVIEAHVSHAALPEASLFGGGETDNHGNVGNAQREVSQMQQDAPPCPDCGALTVRSGACYKCNECGATTGCG